MKRIAPHPPRSKINLRGCLIETGIAIIALNVLAAIVWYLILKRLNR